MVDGLVIGTGDDRGEPAIRRHAMRLAAFSFGGEEAIAIVRQQRADDAVLRHPGLHIDDARTLFAAGAARDLMQELKRTLGRA